MKAQEIRRNMKRNIIWISAVLTLMGLLGLASISLAVEDTWATKADMPTARMLLSTSTVNGKIYAFGGAQGSHAEVALSTVEEYDPATDTWTTKAAMPTARQGLSTSVVNGKIYAFGGAQVIPTQGALSTVEEYDPATDTWTTKAHMPTARLYFSTSAVDGMIYAVGGSGQANLASIWTVEEYNPATDTWTTKAHMPKARMHFSTGAVDGKIYAIGGSFIGFPWTPVSTVEEYDTGFVPPIINVDSSITSVDAIGKLATTWGKIK